MNKQFSFLLQPWVCGQDLQTSQYSITAIAPTIQGYCCSYVYVTQSVKMDQEGYKKQSILLLAGLTNQLAFIERI